MPIFEVSGKNGAVFEIDAPDEKQALRAYQLNHARDIGEAGSALPSSQRDPSGRLGLEGGGTTAGVMSAIEGFPVVGPTIRSGVENVASKLGSAISGRPSDEIRNEMTGMVESAQAANPITSTLGGIGGAVLGTAPLVAALPGAFGAAAGPMGGSLLARTLMSGGSGSALGAADATARGNDPLSGAAWGGGLGLAGPAMGQAIGAGARYIGSRLPGMSGTGAEQAFGRAAGADAVDDITARLGLMGDEAMPMDLGPNLQRQAAAVASTPGRGQEIVRSAVNTRDAGAPERIKSAVNTNLGKAYPPSKIDAGLAARKDLVINPQYEPLLKKGKAVDTQAIANDIDSAIANERGSARTALKSVREMLGIQGSDQLDPSPRAMLNVRHALDGMLKDTQDTNIQRVIGGVRKKLDAQLAKSVPGIKAVDAKFADIANQREALVQGKKVLSMGENTPWPEELASQIAEGGPDIRRRLAQGARSDMERIIGTNSRDRVELQRLIAGRGDWNRQKLTELFGKDKTDRVLSVLNQEKAFVGTSDAVTKNAETAARLAAQAETTRPESKPGIFASLGNIQFGSASREAIKKTWKMFGGADQEKINTQLAELLSSRDPKKITSAIGIVQAAQKRGEISAQAAKEITQAVAATGAKEGRTRLPVR